MVFYMSGEVGTSGAETHLIPKAIVAELDRYIVGQDQAKRAVAIALRNRLRRMKLPPEMAEEVAPKNIIMKGSTGVGKTEIARRLARLTGSPFIKVEASKYTEVGYVGRDVESMVRDLVDISVEMVRAQHREKVRSRAARAVEDRLLNLLLPPPRARSAAPDPERAREEEERRRRYRESRAKLRAELRAGSLDERPIELEVRDGIMPGFQILGSAGEEMSINIQQMIPGLFQGKAQRQKMPIGEARTVIAREEEDRLIDKDDLAREAIRHVEEAGIIFLDELDKIAGREAHHGPDISREGVQRDILPIVEGTSVKTKYGMVRTDHILFIGAGAFHVSKPSDLIPELQGRFPIRVELEPLTEEDLVRILTEPENALTRQYTALMATEGVELSFTRDGIEAIAEIAAQVNERTEDIGARRLHTILEKVLDEISFDGPDLSDRHPVIDGDYVRKMVSDIAEDEDLSKYIL
ncbi:MAG: ATP-dependent protease ATPase subunit HslU [Acidobacteriota bacterium]